MKISIITVCFNSELTIRDTIESVLSQTYSNIEYIVIDGKSNDGTLSIINNYKGQISKVICEPDQGIYDAMNKGLALATGDVVGCLNSDDYFVNNNVVADLVSCFEDDVDVVLSGVEFVAPRDASKVVRRYPAINFHSWMLRFGVMPPHLGAYIKRKTYVKVGFYKEDFQIASDFDFFVRLFQEPNLKVIKTILTSVYMRTGGISTSGLKSKFLINKEILRSLKENGVYSNIVFIYGRFLLKIKQIF